MRRSGEVGVTETALAALGYQDSLILAGEVGENVAGLRVGDYRAERHLDDHIGAVGAVLVFAAPMPTAGGAVESLIPLIDQGPEGSAGLNENAASVAPVPSVGSTVRHKFLAPETHTPPTAGAGLYDNLGGVNELGQWSRRIGEGRRTAAQGGSRPAGTARRRA